MITHDPEPVMGAQVRLMRRFVTILALWTALTTAANLLLPGSPGDAWFVLVVIAALIGPPVVFVIAYRTRNSVRATVLSLDISAVTAVQGMRIAGIAMLSLWAAKAITPAFALWAGGLDVFIGLTAVPVAYLAANRVPRPRRSLRLWHIIGLLDFTLAVPLGVLCTPSSLGILHQQPSTYAMFAFPLSFIPMVGVPFMIIMHLTALFQLRDHRNPVAGPLLHA
jgi:hypothetical protein